MVVRLRNLLLRCAGNGKRSARVGCNGNVGKCELGQNKF